MVVLKLIRNSAGRTDYIRNLSRYFFIKKGEPRKDYVTSFGYGVDCFDVDQVYSQMVKVQKYFGKTDFNPLLHFVVCYGKNVKTEKKALKLSLRIAEYFQYQYQILGAIHQKDWRESKYHLHLMVNAVSYLNGTMVNSWKPYIEDFRKYVMLVTGQPVYFEAMLYTDDI